MNLLTSIPARTMMSDCCRRTAFNYWLVGQQQPFVMIAGPVTLAEAEDLLRENPDIARELKGRGVLAWVGDDDFVRVVAFEWLNTKAEIYKFVTSEPQPGNITCRFRTAAEAPDSLELLEVDGVHIHQRCRQFWNKWTRMAQKMDAAA